MKLTNNHDLPDYLQRWLEFDEYDHIKGVISATGLLSAVRPTILKMRHFDDLEIDLSDLIARRYGTAIHDSFEKVPMKRITKEVRAGCTIEGREISGKYDMLKDLKNGRFRLIDIKSTSAWNYVYGSSVDKWKLQLSIYKYILEQDGWMMFEGKRIARKGIKVDDFAEVCLAFTDWKRADALKNDKYPRIRVGYIDMVLYSIELIEGIIIDRLEAIEDGEKLDDDDLPLCTEEELWIKNKWAVKKQGNKKATKVFKDEREAQQFAQDKGDEYEIEFRQGTADACLYCDARSVCNQFIQLNEEGLIKVIE